MVKRKRSKIAHTVRNYEFYVFAAKVEDSSVPYLVHCPDLDVTTQGMTEDDAFFMGQDACSMMLDNLAPWVRPSYGRTLHEAREALAIEFPDVPKEAWVHRPVRMIVPYPIHLYNKEV